MSFLKCKNDYTEETLDLIISIIEIIIRYGCPVEARNDFGDSAKELAEGTIEELIEQGCSGFEPDDSFLIKFLVLSTFFSDAERNH